MSNKPKLPILFALLALVAVLLVLQPNMNAQEPATPDSAGQQPSDPASPQAAMAQAPETQAQTFMGKIAKVGDNLVLKDSASKAIYVLDDQEQAKRFAGQSVKVTGTLDPQSNMIHVASIEPGS